MAALVVDLEQVVQSLMQQMEYQLVLMPVRVEGLQMVDFNFTELQQTNKQIYTVQMVIYILTQIMEMEYI